ncbi:guanine nucleotide exchange factor for Rab-3A isoform X2 [Brienomyrus brachyistius]|uniref:guanine nucleotide exchange factor for Rab-3A isoform X2 n=1 Tax=Brienomyrus brachyistius TaxID=42636 RepID=UPI0020B3F193|nr:guanine nucleotide exchange factor for Rab-3A isoform X2 [Brienomyrus brachyistius]
MDAFEGIHCVQLSPSLKPAVSSGPGYEVLVTGNSAIAVYSSATFFGQLNTSAPQAEESRPSTQKDGCAVGRLVDLEPESEPGTGPSSTGTGQAVSMPLAKQDPDGGKREQYNLSRLRSSSLEIKEKGSEILKEQLDTAQRELQLKDKECERLSRVRDQLEQELEELTASLFEEAHKMVREANVKQAAAEKQLKEAQGKIDVLQAEVTALKTLVLTSTPSSPNRQMHPQLMSPGLGSKRGTPRTGGGHFRNKSASGVLALDVTSQDHTATPTKPGFQEGREIDSSLYAEFLTWREAASLDCTSAFLSRVYKEDIRPCLSFTCSELSEAVQAAVENNSLTIEPAAAAALPVMKASAAERSGSKKCALTGVSRVCQHRIKLGDKGMYYYISPSSRARITAVCNFFTYIRYIQQGLVRQDAEQTFWEVMRLRREMAVARLGYFTADES